MDGKSFEIKIFAKCLSSVIWYWQNSAKLSKKCPFYAVIGLGPDNDHNDIVTKFDDDMFKSISVTAQKTHHILNKSRAIIQMCFRGSGWLSYFADILCTQRL